MCFAKLSVPYLIDFLLYFAPLFFHTDIKMDILHTVLYTFPRVLTKSIYSTIKSFFSSLSFPIFSLPQCAIQG